jgi:hypothetical protein
MNHTLPDWMFAAFAIGAWELFDLIARHWHQPHARWGGAGVVVLCAATLIARYIVRLVRKLRHTESPDPNEWKQY